MARRRKTNTAQVAKRPRRRAKRSNPASNAPALAANPPLMEDLFSYIAPAAGGYVAGRIASHIAVGVVKDKSRLVRGAACVGAPIALGAGAWWMAHGKSFLGQRSIDTIWHNVMVGLGVSALQSVAQWFIPKYAVLLDCPVRATDAAPALAPPKNGSLGMGEYRAPRRDAIDDLLDNSDLTGHGSDDSIDPELEDELRSGIFGE